jgi:hypothetical protein
MCVGDSKGSQMEEKCSLCGEKLWSSEELTSAFSKDFIGLQSNIRFRTKNGDVCPLCAWQIGYDTLERDQKVKDYKRGKYYASLPWYKFYKHFLPFPEDSKEVRRFWKLVVVAFSFFVIGRLSTEWGWVNEICNVVWAIYISLSNSRG